MNGEKGQRYELGLIGYPLGHSLSPVIQRAALEANLLKGDYRLFPIPPTEEGQKEIEKLLNQVRSSEMKGLNVTIPHKQNVQKFLDGLSITAKAVGAVNTIFVDHKGRLVGENTDVPGFLKDVSQLTTGKKGKAVVFGAGGSARAVVYALSQSGWDVVVLARRVEQADLLVREFRVRGGSRPQISTGLLSRDNLAALQPGCNLLVNTTPIGMYPKTADCPWPEDLSLPADCVVYDLVYNPLETRLLQRARQSGLAAANGAGMLISQAALAFALWTGLEPPFEVMQKAFPARLPEIN